jgi:hypothetical protein
MNKDDLVRALSAILPKETETEDFVRALSAPKRRSLKSVAKGVQAGVRLKNHSKGVTWETIQSYFDILKYSRMGKDPTFSSRQLNKLIILAKTGKQVKNPYSVRVYDKFLENYTLELTLPPFPDLNSAEDALGKIRESLFRQGFHV